MSTEPPGSATRFIWGQIDEIRWDPALLWYGASIAAVNSLTAFHWLTRQPVSRILDPALAPICWPFIPDCRTLRVLTPDQISAVVCALLALGIVNVILFLRPRYVAVAFWLLLAATALKMAILLEDYRLILNQHYMSNWVVFSFLFVPSKRRTLPYLLVLFYVWAGLLKLNAEWLSGEALYGLRPLNLPQAWIPAACAYVIALELVIVFGVLSRRPWVFWSAFSQLIFFHISSFWVVGAFYPVLMFLLLPILFLVRYFGPRGGSSCAPLTGLRSLVSGREPASTYCLVATFCLAQVGPVLVFPGDSSITGEGRMFALHMFDAPTECRASAVFRGPGGQRAEAMRAPFVHNRIACDPIVYLNLAREYCRALHATASPDSLDVVLETRKAGDDYFQNVVSITSFCAANPSYSIWRHNSWISASRKTARTSPSLLQQNTRAADRLRAQRTQE
jgi:hypothetical protein